MVTTGGTWNTEDDEVREWNPMRDSVLQARGEYVQPEREPGSYDAPIEEDDSAQADEPVARPPTHKFVARQAAALAATGVLIAERVGATLTGVSGEVAAIATADASAPQAQPFGPVEDRDKAERNARDRKRRLRKYRERVAQGEKPRGVRPRGA